MVVWNVIVVLTAIVQSELATIFVHGAVSTSIRERCYAYVGQLHAKSASAIAATAVKN